MLDFTNTVINGDDCWVYGYDPEPIFVYNGNTRALNTTSLKCCLPSADTINRRVKNQACV